MLWTPLTQRALITAAQLHDGQYRKGGINLTPLIAHPIEVANIVSRYTNDEEIIAAALLHDTLEDAEYLPEQLTADFGERVARIVVGVTIPQAIGVRDWAADRRSYVINLMNAGEESALVAAADKIHNFRAIVSDYADDPLASTLAFSGSVDDRLLVYGAIVNAVVGKVPEGLAQELSDAWGAYTLLLESLRALIPASATEQI